MPMPLARYDLNPQPAAAYSLLSTALASSRRSSILSLNLAPIATGIANPVLILFHRLLLAAAILCAALTAAEAADNDKVAAELKKFIDSGEPAIGNEDSDERIIEVYLFYADDRDYKPVWVRDTGPKSKAKEILDEFKNAAN